MKPKLISTAVLPTPVTHVDKLQHFLQTVCNYKLPLPPFPYSVGEKFLLLFNPVLPYKTLLHQFEIYQCWAAKDGFPNDVEQKLYEKKFYKFGTVFSQPYYFYVSKDHAQEEHFSILRINNFEQVVFDIEQNPESTLSLAEALIYNLYCQYEGAWSGFPNQVVVTSSFQYEGIYDRIMPITVGLHPKTLRSTVSSYYAREIIEQRVIFKKVYRNAA
jgi:hypothetical protein